MLSYHSKGEKIFRSGQHHKKSKRNENRNTSTAIELSYFGGACGLSYWKKIQGMFGETLKQDWFIAYHCARDYS